MKPHSLFLPLDSIISMECQFISLHATCGSHISDFNNLHAVLWMRKQAQQRKSTAGLYSTPPGIISLLEEEEREKGKGSCSISIKTMWQNVQYFCYQNALATRERRMKTICICDLFSYKVNYFPKPSITIDCSDVVKIFLSPHNVIHATLWFCTGLVLFIMPSHPQTRCLLWL